jgi:hypothetical protein
LVCIKRALSFTGSGNLEELADQRYQIAFAEGWKLVTLCFAVLILSIAGWLGIHNGLKKPNKKEITTILSGDYL